MTTKSKTQIMSHDDTVMSPITKASNVLFEDGKTAQDKLEDNVEKSFTPSVENSSSMFKVGQGDSVDYSDNVLDGAYEECVLKGRSLVNCIQEPSSQDVILPYEFTEGQYVTINDTKESGALGVELKGQTLVNLMKSHPHGCNYDSETGIYTSTKNEWVEPVSTDYSIKVNTPYTLFAKVNTTASQLYIRLDYKGGTIANDSIINGDVTPNKDILIKMVVNFKKEDKIRFVLRNASGGIVKMSEIILIEGDYTNQDIPYFEGIASVKSPTVKTVGKNLFDGELELGIISSVNGVLTPSTNRIRSMKYLMVNSSTTYTLSNDLNYANNIIYEYDRSLNYIGRGRNSSTTFTTSSNCKYIKFSTADGENNLNVKYQLENGSTVTTYEPHKSNTLTLPNEVVLRSLPNGVQDTYNTRTGEYVKRIGERVFYGTEKGWKYRNLSNNGEIAVFSANTGDGVGIEDWKIVHDAQNETVACDSFLTHQERSGIANISALNKECLAYFLDPYGVKFIYIAINKNKASDLAKLKSYLASNPITVQYELETPIITKLSLQSILKSWNTTTHIYSEIPENSLYPILSRSNPTYPVILKPSTKYSIVANSYSNGHTNAAINFNLGGATASTTVGNRVTTITTPSTLSNELLTMSGRGNKLNNVMVIEGDVVGDEPYFEGICDVKSPVVKNVGKNLFDLNGEWVKCTYSYGVPQAAPYTPTITISNNGFSITSHINSYNSGFGQYVDVSSLDILYVRATAIYTDTKTVPELKIIGLYENESIPSSVNSTNSSDFKVITKKFSSEQEVSFDLDVRSYSKIFMMFSGGWKSEMSGSYTFTMKNVYIGSSNQTCEPHKSNTTAFNQKDGQTIVLRSLQNGVCDTLNVETGECVSNIAQIVLNGSENENWKLYYDASSVKNPRSFFITLAEGQTAKPGQNIFATDRYPVKKLTTQECAWYFDLNGHKIAFSDIASRCADVSKWREYLKANPITLCYQRISPIITTIDVQGFPYAYKDGHVQLSSDYNGQSLTPKIEYSLPINRNCQIRTNQAMVERHQKQIDELQAIILANLVNNQYKQTLATLQYELSRV